MFLYEIEKKKLINKLSFHQKGVQSMAFTLDSRYLITLGVQGEDAIAIWDINSGLVVKSALIRNYATNQIRVDPHVDQNHVQFVTVGNEASLTFWRFDLIQQQLSFYDISVPENLKNVNFLSVSFTS